MSEEQSRSRSPRRSGGRVNRNNSGRNEGNRNGQKRNNNGGNNRSGGRNNNGGRRNGGRRQPVKLTLWQQILTFFGAYDPRIKGPRKPKPAAKKAKPQSNDRSPRERKPRSQSQDKEKLSIGQPVKTERKPRERRPATNNRVHVGNLSYDASEADLEELFKGVGAVRNVEIIYNRQTHRSKGYGFITMGNDEEAQRAVDVLHDQFFLGRKLSVNGASERPEETETAAPQKDEATPAPAAVEEEKPAEAAPAAEAPTEEAPEEAKTEAQA